MSNSNDDYHSVLDSFPYLTLIKVTQSGSETLFWTPDALPNNPEYWGTAEGPPYDAAGKWAFGTCKANVEVIVGQTNVGFCELWQPAPTTVYTIVEGKAEVFWNRGKLESNYCGPSQSPCYTITGGFDVTVERLAAELTLTASSTVVGPNSPVSLTAAVTPSWVADLQMPFEVLGWTWYPDSGDTQTPCYPPPRNTNPATCDFSPSVSGRMEIQAIANGVEESKSLRIRVNFCPPSDDPTGRLDDPDVRKQILREIDASRPAGSTRYERPGYIGEREDGSDVLIPVLDPNATDCESSFNPGPPQSGITLKDPYEWWHTHPSKLGEGYVTCKKAEPGAKHTDPRPSEADSLANQQLLAQVPPGQDVYGWIFSGQGYVFRLDRAHPGRDTAFGWKFDASDPNLCMSRIQ